MMTTNVRKQRGVTAQGILVSLVILISVSTITITKVSALIKAGSRTAQLQSFQSDSFMAMRAYYLDYVNTNGYCYNVLPPATTPISLVLRGLLDNRYIESTFYDAQNARLTFEANATTGRVDNMQIEISVIDYDARELFRLPNVAEITTDTVRFERPLERNYSNLVIQTMSSSHCQG